MNYKITGAGRSIIEISIILALFIAAWLFTRFAYLFLAALGLCLLFAAGMVVYLLINWRRLPGLDRQRGMFALVGWLAMAYVVIHINGLGLMSLWA